MEVNAFYSMHVNGIFVPAGILQALHPHWPIQSFEYSHPADLTDHQPPLKRFGARSVSKLTVSCNSSALPSQQRFDHTGGTDRPIAAAAR